MDLKTQVLKRNIDKTNQFTKDKASIVLNSLKDITTRKPFPMRKFFFRDLWQNGLLTFQH